MTDTPLPERLEAYAQQIEAAVPFDHPGADLLREAKAALEDAGLRLRDCRERGFQDFERAEAAEARAKELEGANELRSELLWKQTRRVGELTEALGDVLEARRQFGCLSSGAAEHRLHLAAEKAQDVLAGRDGGEK